MSFHEREMSATARSRDSPRRRPNSTRSGSPFKDAVSRSHRSTPMRRRLILHPPLAMWLSMRSIVGSSASSQPSAVQVPVPGVGADVVVPVYRDVPLTMACLRSVLGHSGDDLERVIVVNDASPEPEMSDALRSLRDQDRRVRIFSSPRNRGFIWSANIGLSAGMAEVVVLNSDAEVTPGWLRGLLGALASNAKLAAVSPLSNNAGVCSVPQFMGAVAVEELKGRQLDLSTLPVVTEMPTAHGFCLALRRRMLDEIGLLDLAYGRGYQEENDWCQRARRRGHVIGRANRVLVYHHGEVSFAGERQRLDVVNLRRIVARYPAYLAETRAFESSPAARLPSAVVGAQLDPRISVGRRLP